MMDKLYIGSALLGISLVVIGMVGSWDGVLVIGALVMLLHAAFPNPKDWKN